MKTIDIPNGYTFKRYNSETNKIELEPTEETQSQSNLMYEYITLLRFKQDYFITSNGNDCNYYIVNTDGKLNIVYSHLYNLSDFKFIDKEEALMFLGIYEARLKKIKELL